MIYTGSTKVIGFGAMNLDELYRVQSVLSDDETLVKEHQSLPGGSAANTIYGLARLGIDTAFIGAVGDDKAGALLLQDIKSVGVDISQVKVKEHAKTGSVLGLTDQYGRRALYVAPGANSLLTREDISLEYIRRAGLIHLSSFVDDQQFQLQKWVLSSLPESIKVSFTPGAIYTRRGLKALAPILAKTDILFTNENEIEELAGADFRTAARYFLSEGCQLVVVTLGKGTLQKINTKQLTFEFAKFSPVPLTSSTSDDAAYGNESEPSGFASYVADANNEYVIESRPGYARDTTGAGDAFAAGFLFGLIKQRKLDECGRLGDTMAHFAMREIGARAGLPTLPALKEMLPAMIDF